MVLSILNPLLVMISKRRLSLASGMTLTDDGQTPALPWKAKLPRSCTLSTPNRLRSCPASARQHATHMCCTACACWHATCIRHGACTVHCRAQQLNMPEHPAWSHGSALLPHSLLLADSTARDLHRKHVWRYISSDRQPATACISQYGRGCPHLDEGHRVVAHVHSVPLPEGSVARVEQAHMLPEVAVPCTQCCSGP